MTLGETGEFALIAQLTAGLAADDRVRLGPGDDGAVVRLRGDLVVSTDALVEGVHFRRNWSSAEQIGRKAVAVNVADIEAMGARPVAVVVAFCAPADLPAQWARDCHAGMREEAARAGVALVGGDITRSRDVTLTVTALGETGDRAPVLRSGARPGDVVALRGRIGWAAAGLAVLQRGFRSPRACVAAQQTPEPPYGAGIQAAEAGATAMIDVSDGLLADLGHIAEASGVRIDVRADTIEVPDPLFAVAAALGGADPRTFVLTGGEDHALAATFPPGAVPADWVEIGVVLPAESGTVAVTVDGAAWEGSQGWDHYA
ncbi:thiamine-phosphate kinase [Granulicoccus phenolivorans]|uniref:thiamine-phosphate kinase n=1 Tax=Granulicoccus phenolivorans TaxID=266854 RepID=UPI0004130EB1|nr:thiamine-phosphate kinase [Granulicoccus phenolivorans]